MAFPSTLRLRISCIAATSPHRRSARTSARHDVMMICAKYAIETSRDRDRQRILAELARNLRPAGGRP